MSWQIRAVTQTDQIVLVNGRSIDARSVSRRLPGMIRVIAGFRALVRALHCLEQQAKPTLSNLLPHPGHSTPAPLLPWLMILADMGNHRNVSTTKYFS